MLWALRQSVSGLKVVESYKLLEGFVKNLVYSRTWNWQLIACGTN